MSAMSEGYVQTLDSLERGGSPDLTFEFRKGLVVPVKKLYAEAAETYPVRFSKVNDWCAWTKQLYILTRKAEDALAQGRMEDAKQDLAALRDHLDALHNETGVIKSNDRLYAFWKALNADTPDLERLKALRKAIEEAEPSAKAKAEADAYEKAKSEWSTQVAPLLDGGALQPEQVKELRERTKTFYRAYGIQFG